MAIIETGERHQELLDALLEEVAGYDTPVDRELITRAFRYAATAHDGQQRRSGEPFIMHPTGVAQICAQLRLDERHRFQCTPGFFGRIPRGRNVRRGIEVTVPMLKRRKLRKLARALAALEGAPRGSAPERRRVLHLALR